MCTTLSIDMVVLGRESHSICTVIGCGMVGGVYF